MAFNGVTAAGVSSLSVALLTRTLALPMTVARVPGGEFRGPNGGTITVRVRQPRTAQTQDAPGDTINYNDINETPVDVSLTHLYDAARLTDEDLTLNIEDFGAQVTEPQVAAVGVGAEDQLASAMNGLPASNASFSDIDASLLEAREFLSTNNVPASNRTLAVAPDVMTMLLETDKFVRADAIGDGSAIRSATTGRVYGFTVVESNGLDVGTALAYHRSGFAFATAVPVAPRGANDSATASYGGIGLRQIFQYQPDI